MRARVEMEWPEHPENGEESAPTSDTLRSWLVRGTHKLGVHPRRGIGRNRRARELLATDTGWLPGDHSGWRGLVTALQRHSVLSALAQLHRNDRQILTMAYLQGHTNIEIARTLSVSVRTVSRRLSTALARLEEHARSAGIWIASLVLVALAILSKPHERAASLVRSVQWQQAAGVVAAGTAVVAVGLAATNPATPSTEQSTFSPSARSIVFAPEISGAPGLIAPGPTTVLLTTVPLSDTAVHVPKAKVQASSTLAGSDHGCGPKPTNAPPAVPVRAHHPSDPPVTNPGPRALGCRAV